MSNGMIRDTNRQPAPELERLVAQYQGAVLRTCYLYLCGPVAGGRRGTGNVPEGVPEPGQLPGRKQREDLDNRRVTPEMLPEASVPFTERDDALTQAVMRLPEKLRRVIILYYYQGLSVREIAETLGITQPSVSSRMKRGREKLKAALEGREIDE